VAPQPAALINCLLRADKISLGARSVLRTLRKIPTVKEAYIAAGKPFPETSPT
jgi:hypothetical protein